MQLHCSDQGVHQALKLPALFRAVHYGLYQSFPGSTSIQNPRWRLVSGMFEFQQKNSAFQRSLHNVETCQRLESIPKSFAEVHRYPKLFYYYRASKYLPCYEKDEVNALALDEDTSEHCGLALYPTLLVFIIIILYHQVFKRNQHLDV